MKILELKNRLEAKIHRYREHIFVKKDASSLKLSDKVLFLDLGSNLGQGYKWFKQYYNHLNIKFELFEPNPFCCDELKKIPEIKSGKVILHDIGVGVSSGRYNLYGLDSKEGGRFAQGGSVIKEHNSDIYEVEEDNAIRNDGSVHFIGNAKVTAKLRTTSKQSSGVEGNFILEPNNQMLGYDYLSSSLVPSDLSKGSGSNLSALLFGDFSQLMLGYYSGVDVVVDPYTGSSAGTTRLAFFQDMDVAIRDENAFSVCKDIVTT